MSKRRQPWKTGDVFAVPQSDGKFALGQVIEYVPRALNSVVCAFYDLRVDHAVESVEPKLEANKLIAILFVTRDLLDRGEWKVVARHHVANARSAKILDQGRANDFIGTKIVGSGNVRRFLNAYYGLEPWDDWHDPEYLDSLLLSPDRKPKNAVFAKGKKP
ncbi:MAG: hypothetical protein HY292_27880 [Planctomycetes bacterium]|nr:hypothetical protein [Planctomycetota bacterium]